MKRGVIFGAGEYGSYTPDIKDGDYIVAADAGCLACKKYGIVPDITVGDFDSCGFLPDGRIIVLPEEKDITDLDAAAAQALGQGCGELHIYGGTGGRPDHTLANISLAARLAEQKIKVFFYGVHYDITALCGGKIFLHGKKGRGISVFSWTDSSGGVTLRGLKYPLENAELTNTFALGVSNSFEAENAEISVERGILIIMGEKLFSGS